MKILLIGGAGFIGHHLALQLKKEKHEVTVIDGLQVNNFLSLMHDLKGNEMHLGFLQERFRLLHDAEIPLIVQDARDYHKMSRLMSNIRPDIVIHLAAVAHANRSNKDPYSTFDHSLQTLEIALDVAKSPALKGCVKQFIYFSSSMVYGNFPEGEGSVAPPQVTERSLLNPLGIYGALKNAGELMVRAYHQVFNLPYTIIRPSALYGPRCISGRVVQKFIENAIAGKPLSIMGDGEDMLDFTYIDDLVHGVVGAVADYMALNETFNITYGEARSIGDLAKIVKLNFPRVEINRVPRDKLMPVRGTLVVDKARRLLGYDPQWPIEAGVIKYMNWYMNRG